MKMINWDKQKRTSEEVYHATDAMIKIENEDIEFLIKAASTTKRQRIRYCSHHNVEELVHEMFIIHPCNAYVRPHRHIKHIESILIIKGDVDYLIFNKDGSLHSILPMGDCSSGKPFYNSLRESEYHSLLIYSDWLVFLEITQGPLIPEDVQFANWSPLESNKIKVDEYMKNIKNEIKEIKDGIL